MKIFCTRFSFLLNKMCVPLLFESVLVRIKQNTESQDQDNNLFPIYWGCESRYTRARARTVLSSSSIRAKNRFHWTWYKHFFRSQWWWVHRAPQRALWLASALVNDYHLTCLLYSLSRVFVISVFHLDLKWRNSRPKLIEHFWCYLFLGETWILKSGAYLP